MVMTLMLTAFGVYIVMGSIDCICYRSVIKRLGNQGTKWWIFMPFSGIYLRIKYRKAWRSDNG